MYFDVWLYLISLIKLLFECRPDLSVSMLTVYASNLAGVTHPVSLSPDGKGVAKTSGEYWRYPGRICHYDNGVNGTCVPKDGCHKEQAVLTGYNDTLKCSQHINSGRWNRYCCPDPGEENPLPTEKNAISNLKKLCWAAFFLIAKNVGFIALFGFPSCNSCVY